MSYLDGARASDQVVLVRDGRIDAVGDAGSVSVPPGAVRVPGCGRFLVPGLADMHVHLARTDLAAYLAAGVTTVRNLWGFPDLLVMRDEIDAGSLVGPSVYVISSGIDGTPAKWPYTQFVLERDDAEPVIAAQADLGYTTLKLYQDLTLEAFEAVVEVADDRALRFGGHVPHRVGLERALASGYRFVEHLSGYEAVLNPSGPRGAFGWRTIDKSLIPSLVQITLDAGTWNSPTLEIFAQIAGYETAVVSNRQSMVRALFDAGAPLLIGTDAGIGRTAPGVSLHQEIGQFVAAGLTPLDALRIATIDAARFLGEEDEFGQVAVGFRADLVLVDGDPTVDVGVLARPDAVIARGVRVK